MSIPSNQVLSVIKSRRSHRAYAPQQLKEDELQAIMEAAIWAPSGRNSQAWHFSVVQNQSLIDEIVAAIKEQAASLPAGNRWRERLMSPEYHTFYHAPTVIFISAEKGPYAEMDTSAAAQNILLAAESLGIGSIYIMSHRTAFEGPKGAVLAEKLGVPQGYQVYQSVALGYKVSQPAPPERKAGVITYIR